MVEPFIERALDLISDHLPRCALVSICAYHRGYIPLILSKLQKPAPLLRQFLLTTKWIDMLGASELTPSIQARAANLFANQSPITRA